ncbi:MAG: acylphosphatase [Deinococcales bacterium]
MFRLTVLIHGKVQGVGYRAFARRHALDLGLAGYVENLSDGRVEVVAEGHQLDLEHYLVFLQKGPPHALVEGIDSSWSAAGGLKDFYLY